MRLVAAVLKQLCVLGMGLWHKGRIEDKFYVFFTIIKNNLKNEKKEKVVWGERGSPILVDSS